MSVSAQTDYSSENLPSCDERGVLQVQWMDIVRKGEALIEEAMLHGVHSADELRRAQNMSCADDRLAFLGGRAVLRFHLGRRLGEAAYKKPFSTSPAGKPFARDTGLHFSLSRAPGLVAIVSFDGPVGIDVEREKVIPGALRRDLSRAVRSISADVRCVSGLSAQKSTWNPTGGMNAWTLLEAFSKLHETRLAEHFAKWRGGGVDPGNFPRSPRDPLPTPAFILRAPPGYIATCCCAMEPREIWQSNFAL